MRASIFLVFCVLSCFCAKLAICEVVGQEGKTKARTRLTSASKIKNVRVDIILKCVFGKFKENSLNSLSEVVLYLTLVMCNLAVCGLF